MLQRILSSLAGVAVSLVAMIAVGMIQPTCAFLIYQPGPDEIPEELLK